MAGNDPNKTPFLFYGNRRRRVLTRLDQRILSMMATGWTTKGIAIELGIAFKTVEHHRDLIRKIVGVNCVAGLVHYALHTGLVRNIFKERF